MKNLKLNLFFVAVLTAACLPADHIREVIKACDVYCSTVYGTPVRSLATDPYGACFCKSTSGISAKLANCYLQDGKDCDKKALEDCSQKDVIADGLIKVDVCKK